MPVDCEPEVTGPRPIFRERIFGGEGVEKMIGIGLSEEFNAKVINGKSKSGTTGVAKDRGGGLRHSEVTKRSEVCFENNY